MTVQNDEDWLTIGEAAALFGASTEVVKRLLKNEGTLVQHLNAGRIRVRRCDVLRLKKARVRPIE